MIGEPSLKTTGSFNQAGFNHSNICKPEPATASFLEPSWRSQHSSVPAPTWCLPLFFTQSLSSQNFCPPFGSAVSVLFPDSHSFTSSKTPRWFLISHPNVASNCPVLSTPIPRGPASVSRTDSVRCYLLLGLKSFG